MRYENSQNNEKLSVVRILSAINFILVIFIVFCINYMIADFLFR